MYNLYILINVKFKRQVIQILINNNNERIRFRMREIE